MSLSCGGINKTVNLGLTPVDRFPRTLVGLPYWRKEILIPPRRRLLRHESDAAKQDGPSEFDGSLQFCHI